MSHTRKIDTHFIQDQYRSGVESYTHFTKEVGLWQSEEYVFDLCLKRTDRLLDLGCGTGRTTFPLYQKGFQNIIGVDLTPEMIQAAQQLNASFGTTIQFQIGDATQLTFEEAQFDAVIFSFNGIMSIPKQANRDQAFTEIHRVLRPEGLFIFTTHDRDCEPQFMDFWKAEDKRWAAGSQNTQLYEFGDLVTTSKNESREIFIHIPTQEEVHEQLAQTGFEVLETFYRSERFDESEAVKAKSGECRFWVAKKKHS